ncbi:hypothetical protein KEM56_002413 [Ascosphaera pollenicola]|nr:hypothetical protein KEM56_002413 [Ascosphaera pollenicola]
MAATAASKEDLSTWDTWKWERKMEGLGANDEPITAKGPNGELHDICTLGELTDKGRQTTFALGQRLRHLYITQLGFMPAVRSNTDDIYLRSTPIPRALESLQSAFWGMYPPQTRIAPFTRPTVVMREFGEETLFPNEAGCRRFRQLARLFADEAARQWNDSKEMEYINSKISKYMPPATPRVAVDGHPRLSGVMDTLNASLAHGPATRLPSEFYDEKVREYIDKISVDEWYAGYREDVEYRRLGIGGLWGDVTRRMEQAALKGGWRPDINVSDGEDKKETPAVKMALSGCHDTTLASLLASVGAYDSESWPPFTSSVAVELFRRASSPATPVPEASGGIISRLTGSAAASEKAKQAALENHFVRIRFNDKIMRVPGCAVPGNHLEGDTSFCTLKAFMEITDKFRPKDWKAECRMNLEKGPYQAGREKAGF